VRFYRITNKWRSVFFLPCLLFYFLLNEIHRRQKSFFPLLFLKKISWVSHKWYLFQFFDVASLLASHEGLSIKWQEVFRTCLNNF
jgi:hypothetical protein